MKLLHILCLVLISSSLKAQFEKMIHQTFEVEELNEITIKIAGEYTIEKWAGNLILAETNVKLYDASPIIFEHYLKEKRYELASKITNESLAIKSLHYDRKPIRTTRGECLEIVSVKLMVPDDFDISDKSHLYRIELEEALTDEVFTAKGVPTTEQKASDKKEAKTNTTPATASNTSEETSAPKEKEALKATDAKETLATKTAKEKENTTPAKELKQAIEDTTESQVVEVDNKESKTKAAAAETKEAKVTAETPIKTPTNAAKETAKTIANDAVTKTDDTKVETKPTSDIDEKVAPTDPTDAIIISSDVEPRRKRKKKKRKQKKEKAPEKEKIEKN